MLRGPKHKNATALGKPDRFASFAMNPQSTRQPSANIPARQMPGRTLLGRGQ
ncbi:hypothetical protein RBSH_00367 [Rhodopirellula baltica SH28]|uniref:Uncharacterized protein n=1 Tax=Rhodopirellula baltica SH28 TaxID=993517 RepID=K5CJU4_RHOBT|nr:hypothetical protein RBSH_00367 [Rhodopirellula baltica SH28]